MKKKGHPAFICKKNNWIPGTFLEKGETKIKITMVGEEKALARTLLGNGCWGVEQPYPVTSDMKVLKEDPAFLKEQWYQCCDKACRKAFFTQENTNPVSCPWCNGKLHMSLVPPPKWGWDEIFKIKTGETPEETLAAIEAEEELETVNPGK